MDSKNSKAVHFLSKLFITLSIVLMLSPGVFAKDVIGWVENVGVSSSNTIVKAKIDTGADASSLHCECITPYERDGEQWVRFTVMRMDFCIGDQYGETDVSLVDRSGFNYSLLIGRKYLKDKFIVDPGETFMSRPQCIID